MTRWFRFYDEALNDPKILKLPDSLFRIWVGILCVASKNEGNLPPVDDLAMLVRVKPEKMADAIKSLIKSGLIDDDGVVSKPHNWDGRQYKSDVSTERVKRFRKRERNVSETAPDTEQIQTTDTEQKERGSADALPEEIVVPIRPYAFGGHIVRIDQAQLDKWRKTFFHIPDIVATLQSIDDYYRDTPPADGKWFFRTSNWLQKEHNRIAAEIEKARKEARSF